MSADKNAQGHNAKISVKQPFNLYHSGCGTKSLLPASLADAVPVTSPTRDGSSGKPPISRANPLQYICPDLIFSTDPTKRPGTEGR